MKRLFIEKVIAVVNQMNEDVVEVLDFEWDIFSAVLTRIGGTLTVDKAIKIISDDSEDDEMIRETLGLN